MRDARAALPRSRRPVGQPTRGKTARGRLRHLDAFVALVEPGLLTRRDGPWAEAPFVDVGYGAEPWTTLEAAATFRRLRGDLRVLGVEIDPERVAAAQAHADERTAFRHGGFALPLDTGADGRALRARLVRAFNVLRQYDEAQVDAAWALMGRSLLPGGLLLEGTSSPSGGLWVALLGRRPADGDPGAPAGPALESVVFGARLRQGFDPVAFQAVLPKRFIHRMRDGGPVAGFFDAWQAAWRASLPESVWGPRRHFVATAERLAEMGQPVHVPRRLTRRGYLVWRPPAASLG